MKRLTGAVAGIFLATFLIVGEGWAQTNTPTVTLTATPTRTPTNTPTRTPTIPNTVKVGRGPSHFKAFVSGNLAADPNSASANSTEVLVVTILGIQVGDMLVLELPADLHDDIVVKGWRIVANNQVHIYLYNPTGSPIDDTSKSWRFVFWDRT